jgi:hypothetical protein
MLRVLRDSATVLVCITIMTPSREKVDHVNPQEPIRGYEATRLLLFSLNFCVTPHRPCISMTNNRKVVEDARWALELSPGSFPPAGQSWSSCWQHMRADDPMNPRGFDRDEVSSTARLFSASSIGNEPYDVYLAYSRKEQTTGPAVCKQTAHHTCQRGVLSWYFLKGTWQEQAYNNVI